MFSEVHRESRGCNGPRLQHEKFWLNIKTKQKKKKEVPEGCEALEQVVQKGCETSSLGDVQAETVYGPEQHSLTLDLVLL